MTLIKHTLFGDVEVVFSGTPPKVIDETVINRADVVLAKTVGWHRIVATADCWTISSDLQLSSRGSVVRPPSSPLTNLQAALESLKVS